MDSISGAQSSKTDNSIAPLDLNLLKENPQIQQLLLLALSKTNQPKQQPEQYEPSMDNDKRKFDQLNTQLPPSINGSSSDHSSPGSDTNSDKALGRPGRKPLTEEEIKQSDMDPKSKRKAQNRVAQRAFRERRVNYVKELEERIKTLEENQQQQRPADRKLLEENRELKRIVQQLQTENAILGGTASSFDVPLSKLTNITNNGLATTATDSRPQKLLRSIGDDPTATLFSAITATSTHHNDDISSSPDAAVSFAIHNHSIGDNGSSPSVSSKSRSLTPPDTAFGDVDDAILFSSATPTDILNSFDTSQLIMNSFPLDQDLFNTLTTSTDTLTTKPTQLGLASQTPPLHGTTADVTTHTTEVTTTADGSSNDLIESLLVIDDDGTDSSAEAVDNTTNEQACNNMDASRLAQAWDKLAEHPRFDEFDIDFLCDEMKRKAYCSNKSHDESMKEMLDKHYPNANYY